MKTNNRIEPSIHFTYPLQKSLSTAFVILFTFSFFVSRSQAVTEAITDYNGYWKSSSTSISGIKPNNSHNLLAFSYNGVRYSTGVNDVLLSSHGDSFIQGDFWSLPVSSMTGTITSNTKVGFGALYDGVLNGFSIPAPEWGIEKYLTDGIKGLGLGTCVANLPVGSMSFSIQNIQAAAIGDGVPDILVTQIADPSGSYDRYEFTDANGVRVGNYKDIVFTNITPVGNWTADFYDAFHIPLTLSLGFTQTDRPIRLWAADFSEFGITATNLSQIKDFKINLSGNSDVAFVGYNNNSINFIQVLPVQYNFFTASKNNDGVHLAWQTVSQQEADYFAIEESIDGLLFQNIATADAKKCTTSVNNYSYTDKSLVKGTVYYRLKQVDSKGSFTYSKIVKVYGGASATNTIQVFPNPAKTFVVVQHNMATSAETIKLVNAAGIVLKQLQAQNNAVQTKIDLTGLTPGNYFVSYSGNPQASTSRLIIQ